MRSLLVFVPLAVIVRFADGAPVSHKLDPGCFENVKNIEDFEHCLSDSLDTHSGAGASSIANSLSANGLSGLASALPSATNLHSLESGLPSSISAIDLTHPSGISGDTASAIAQGTQSGNLLSSVPMSKLAIPGSGNGDLSGISSALSSGDISGLSNGLASAANRGGFKGFGKGLPTSPISLADPSGFTDGGSTHTSATGSGSGSTASSGGGGGSRGFGGASHFGGAGGHFGGSANNNADPADYSGVKYSAPNGASSDTSSSSPPGPPSGSSDGSTADPSTGYGTSRFSYPAQSSPDGALPGVGDPSATGPSTSTAGSTGDGTPNANQPDHAFDPSGASGPSTGYPSTFGTASNGNSVSPSPDNGDDTFGPHGLTGAGRNHGGIHDGGGAGRGAGSGAQPAGGISHIGKPISNCDGPACTDIDLLSNGGRVKTEPAVTYTSTDLPGLQDTEVPNVSEEETGCPGGDINVCADN